MIAFERVKKLSESRGKNLKQVAADLELGENYFYSWKKSSPKADTLEKVANYFNVSTDYILGRTDNPAIIKPAEEDFDDSFVENMEKEEDIRIIQRAARNMNDEDRKKAMDLWKIAFDKAFEDEK